MGLLFAGLFTVAFLLQTSIGGLSASAQTWIADNGNGTFSNPLFYDEFPDPDLIRVGDDFYLTGTTMHVMPGLPVLHSKDLVNWNFLGYACNRLDFGPEYRLEDGKEMYGQGVWAPSFRYNGGTFFIFANIRGQKTQIFSATDPAGPWNRTSMDRGYHDLSVLFDDDGRQYVVWGFEDIRFAELSDDLTRTIPGTERTLFAKDSGMGEGAHFYKINGTYYICSAVWRGRMRLVCARASKPEGPYEVQVISDSEDFGIAGGARLAGATGGAPFDIHLPDPNMPGYTGSMHQGGIVDTPTGEWWGFSMMDCNSVGRLTCLSPVTWQDGWPYFGLSGNLKRSPRIWVKPNTGYVSVPSAPYQRSDDFSRSELGPIWQWNHAPDDTKWSLTERPGFLRLHSLPADDFWSARNTLTQRAVGPDSVPTVELDATGMEPGDVAGLALLSAPYSWIGVHRQADGMSVEWFDQTSNESASALLQATRVWLRADCNFLTEKARFSYSTDGKAFQLLGDEFTMVFQLITFQGVRYGLFHYNTGGEPGGHVDFDKMVVEEPQPRGLTKPIPTGQMVTLTTYGDGRVLVARDGKLAAVPAGDKLALGPAAQLNVVDRALGRVALQNGNQVVSVVAEGGPHQVKLKGGEPSERETFQWIETPYGDLTLLSLATNCYLRVDPESGALSADYPGPQPGRKDGSCFIWRAGGKAQLESAR